MRFKKKYVPDSLTANDKQKQQRMLTTSRRMYKQGKYYTRRAVSSYRHKTSKHVLKARKLYGVETVAPTLEFSRKTGCSLNALKQIVRKGEGAYYSSGSRPNQTPQSWALARLASAVTGGKASKVDYAILKKGCKNTKPALQLALR